MEDYCQLHKDKITRSLDPSGIKVRVTLLGKKLQPGGLLADGKGNIVMEEENHKNLLQPYYLL